MTQASDRIVSQKSTYDGWVLINNQQPDIQGVERQSSISHACIWYKMKKRG